MLVLRETGDNGNNLLNCFPLAKNHFRETFSYIAVGVDLGKPEIFIREILQGMHGDIDLYFAVAQILEKLLDSIFIYQSRTIIGNCFLNRWNTNAKIRETLTSFLNF